MATRHDSTQPRHVQQLMASGLMQSFAATNPRGAQMLANHPAFHALVADVAAGRATYDRTHPELDVRSRFGNFRSNKHYMALASDSQLADMIHHGLVHSALANLADRSHPQDVDTHVMIAANSNWQTNTQLFDILARR